jgi:diaminohydroxyphosphoribosylaminopyrimidine deaminase / 5-amino-6-(5-phosphoribosylamino)uracil reductase
MNYIFDQVAAQVPLQISQAMALAVIEALKFRGSTAPNPTVGCVLLDGDMNVLALAAHQRAGQAHAEAAALEQARVNGTFDKIRHAVVTLEPCNHTGQTPPCSLALINSPAEQIWIGETDPNPQVAGGGAQALRTAGHAVHTYSTPESEALLAPFHKRVTLGIPFVTVKQAVNRFGSMVPEAGQKTFTSTSSLELAHQLRKRADAILTGSGTILSDNPLFTVRRVEDFPNKVRDLIILDRRKRVPASYIREANARGFKVHLETDLEEAMRGVVTRGGLEVLVEAGPQITQHVLSSRFWDEHVRISQTDQKDVIDVFRNH